MWSLVAHNTREGDVYVRLMEKLEQQRAALGGRVYDVLGQMFEGQSLRDLMIRAIREGDSEEAQAALFEVVDEHVGDGIAEVLSEDQLVPTTLTSDEILEVRKEMERAEAVRLQPHHVESFFMSAFKDLGGNLRSREGNRFEIKAIPGPVKDHDRIAGRGAPVMDHYSRVTFDRDFVRLEGHTKDATLIHPGHPLMASLLSVTLDRHAEDLRKGSVLIDHSDPSLDPYVVCLLEHEVTDGREGKNGRPLVVSRRVQYVRVNTDGTSEPIAQTPVPNLSIPTEEELQHAWEVLKQEWASAPDLDKRVIEFASATLARKHLEEITEQTKVRVEKTRRLVRERLQYEIRYWDRRAHEINEKEKSGKSSKISAARADARAEDLAQRLNRRLADLDLEEAIAATPPRVAGAVLVIPQGWLDALIDPAAAAAHAKETTRIERIAVDAVLDIEHALGHTPQEQPHNNPGFDIESATPNGLDFIEVKGRIEGGDTFVLTKTEAVTALNKKEHSVLALVRVHPDDTTTTRYVRQPLNEPIPAWQESVNADWDYFWEQGTEMSTSR